MAKELIPTELTRETFKGLLEYNSKQGKQINPNKYLMA